MIDAAWIHNHILEILASIWGPVIFCWVVLLIILKWKIK